MGYTAAWKVLEEWMTDSRKRGVPIPAEIMNDLKSAKTMISILKADATRTETAQKIEEYLGRVQAYLLSEGEKRFGSRYVDEWLKRMDLAGRELSEGEREEARFIPGLPRDQKWIRVKPSPELPIEKIKALANEANLSHSVQKDGCLLIHGGDEQLKDFVKKMTIKHKPKA